MSKTKKIIGLIAILAVVGGLVAGLAYLTLGMSFNKDERGLYIDGNKVEDPGVIMTVGGYEVPFGVYRYFYKTAEFSMTGGDDSYLAHDPDGSRAAYLKESTDSYVIYYYTWLTIADEYDVQLTEEEIAAVKETIADQKAQFADDFQTQLDGFYVYDEETYLAINLMEERVIKVTDQIREIVAEQNRTELEGMLLSAEHILALFDDFEDIYADDGTDADTDEDEADADVDVDTTDDTANADVDNEEEENDANEPVVLKTAAEQALEQATWVLEQIQNSDDPVATFRSLRADYDADAGSQPEEGYVFMEGEFVDEFYNATLALAPGEISGLVESSYGYHIILRNALPDMDSEALAENAYNWITNFVNNRYSELEESLEVTYGEYYSKITPTTLK